MKIKAKINSSQKVESELIEEGIGTTIAKFFGFGAKTAPKVTDDVAIASAKVAASLTGKAWMALSQLAKSPGAKEKLLDSISKAEKTDVPQLFTHNIAPGKQVNFYIKPGGKISTKLTDAEQALVKQSGGSISKNLPSLAAQDAAAAGLKPGAKVSAKELAVATNINKISKSAKPGDEVIAGIVKKSDDVFEAPLVGKSGKAKGKVKLDSKGVALVDKFRDMFTDFNIFSRKASRAVKNAKEARDAILKADPKDIARANRVFQQTLEKGGLSQNAIKRQLRISKRLSDKFDNLGYHPQLAKGVFGNVRSTLSSKELSFVSKVMGIPKAVLKDIFGLGKYAAMSVFKTTLKILALAIVGVGIVLSYENLFGVGDVGGGGAGDDDIDLNPYDTYVQITRPPGGIETASKEDIEISSAIDSLYENITAVTITSKIKIISSNHAVLINEQRTQTELDQERKDFEKKYFSSLPEQFNQLDFLGPAGIAHLFGHIMEDDKLSRLRSAAKISYGEFQEEMASIYSGARNMDYLMMGLASLDVATPYFTVIMTSIAKAFPSVGFGGLTLEMFDSEKFIKDVGDDFNKLNSNDWKEFVTPITYQIMLEPGSETVEGFNSKLMKYAGPKFEGLKDYYKPEDRKELEKKEEELIAQSSGSELSELISQLSTEDVKEFVKVSR